MKRRRRNPEEGNFLMSRARALKWVARHPEAVPALLGFDAEERKIREKFSKIYNKTVWERLGQKPEYPPGRGGKQYEAKVAKCREWEEDRILLAKRSHKAKERALEMFSRAYRQRYGLPLEVFNHIRGVAARLVGWDEFGNKAPHMDAVVLNWAEDRLKDRPQTVLTGPVSKGRTVAIIIMTKERAIKKGFIQ
jgi:hypothetical protein